MISVIIPIYNSEATLRRCVDSVRRQTESDLEILLIDDGSKDNSGAIADAYRSDSRIRVFHKQNGGLSSARNCGLDRIRGDYIAFVDADDWIEPDTFEKALACGADVCVFGCVYEYPGKKKPWRPVETVEVIDGEEAVRRLIRDGSIRQTVWTKLYRKHLFDGTRFPEGYTYEDIRTTYRVLQKADRIALIPDVCYHYLQYKSSIAHTQSVKNRLDRWTSMYELFRVFGEKDADFRRACIRGCVHSMFKAWGALRNAETAMLQAESKRIGEIEAFAKTHRTEILGGAYGIRIKATERIVSRGGKGSVFCAYVLNRLHCLLRSTKLFDAKEEDREKNEGTDNTDQR